MCNEKQKKTATQDGRAISVAEASIARPCECV